MVREEEVVMVFDVNDRKLLLNWLLKRPSGSYAPKLAQILDDDAKGMFQNEVDFVLAIDKDGPSMLLFLQFVAVEKRFTWGVCVGLLLGGELLATRLTTKEREWFEMCVTMALCIDTY